MRIFVAIPIADDLKRVILEWEKGKKRGLDERIKWIHMDDLHMTIVPPWYESDVDSVLEKLAGIHGRESFDIDFTEVAYGPLQKNPRLIWAAGPSFPAIVELKTEIESVLSIRSEKREFRPHLTLARFKEEDFRSFSIREMSDKISWRLRVGSFVVMRSNLSSAGAKYEILKEIKI